MAEKRGYDAGKKIVGRKRHIAVDTDGRLLAVNLTTADISDSAGAQLILDAIRERWPWMKHFFADGAYDRRTLLGKAAFLDFVVEVVRRTDTDPGFKVVPRRWVVERSFGWLTRYRRLVRDYEERLDVSEAMIFMAMGNLLLRRITHTRNLCELSAKPSPFPEAPPVPCSSTIGGELRENSCRRHFMGRRFI
jgi:putative transposase